MSDKKSNILKRFWHWFRSPSRIAVGTIIVLSFIGGILSWVGFNYGLAQTNTEEFCASCHTNDAYPEYLHSTKPVPVWVQAVRTATFRMNLARKCGEKWWQQKKCMLITWA